MTTQRPAPPPPPKADEYTYDKNLGSAKSVAISQNDEKIRLSIKFDSTADINSIQDSLEKAYKNTCKVSIDKNNVVKLDFPDDSPAVIFGGTDLINEVLNKAGVKGELKRSEEKAVNLKFNQTKDAAKISRLEREVEEARAATPPAPPPSPPPPAAEPEEARKKMPTLVQSSSETQAVNSKELGTGLKLGGAFLGLKALGAGVAATSAATGGTIAAITAGATAAGTALAASATFLLPVVTAAVAVYACAKIFKGLTGTSVSKALGELLDSNIADNKSGIKAIGEDGTEKYTTRVGRWLKGEELKAPTTPSKGGSGGGRSGP